jgi:thiamine-monophosphate kinase
MDEFALIRLLTSRKKITDAVKPQDGVIVGIGDDAAVVEPSPGRQLVMTCDTMVETVHYLPWTMDDVSIGWKAMASNISDLAAMGAQPRWALIALSVPRDLAVERLQRIYEGLYACADAYGVTVIGGDTTSTPQHAVISVTAVGEVEPGHAIVRSGAKAGDVIFVTGPLGLSAAGLEWLMQQQQGAHHPELVRAHQRPQPQVAAGRALVASRLASALNDVSDGLASEAWEIAEASNVRMVIEEALIPIHESLRMFAVASGKSPLEYILYGGEDYQLVGTAPAHGSASLLRLLEAAGAAPTVIGTVREGDCGVELLHVDGTVEHIHKRGYNHFTSLD